jgi:hypothetical protein
VANARQHHTTGEPPDHRWQREKASLQPLPPPPVGFAAPSDFSSSLQRARPSHHVQGRSEAELHLRAQQAAQEHWSYADYLEGCLVAERDLRALRTRQTLVRIAGFPAIKRLEDYDFDFAVGTPKAAIEQLATLAVSRRQPICCCSSSARSNRGISTA